jgi:hypothetical protein
LCVAYLKEGALDNPQSDITRLVQKDCVIEERANIELLELHLISVVEEALQLSMEVEEVICSDDGLIVLRHLDLVI